MRRFLVPVVFLAFHLSLSQAKPRPQQVPTPQRDAQAVAVVQQAIQSMGGSAPNDSTATGTINLVAGSENESGTITVLTKGTAETSEQITLPSGQRTVIFANGSASESSPSSSGQVGTQLALTDQCADFPLPFLVATFSNPDEALVYVGQETLGANTAQHVRLTNTFASQPGRSLLVPFTVFDVWFDAASGLPVKLVLVRRAAGGSATGIPLALQYSNWSSFGGTLYPLQIQKSFNGTPWQTITIQSVALNTGLTDAQFQIQ